MARESIGDEGGEGVAGGRLDVDGVGDEGGERQDRSRSKSVKPLKMVACITGSGEKKRIVLSSASSTSACTATTVSLSDLRPKDSGL